MKSLYACLVLICGFLFGIHAQEVVYNGFNSGGNIFYGIAQLQNGTHVAVGNGIPSVGASYGCISQILNDGNEGWTLHLGNADVPQNFRSVTVLNDGNILVVGTQGNDQFGTVVKLTSNGELLWTKQYQIVDGLNTVFNQIIQSDNGDIYISSSGMNGNTNILAGVSQIDSDGNLLWTKTYYSYAPLNGGSLAILSDGIISFVGIDPTNNKIYVVKMDASGTIYSESTYSTSENISYTVYNQIALTDDRIVISFLDQTNAQVGLFLLDSQNAIEQVWISSDYSSDANFLFQLNNGGFAVVGSNMLGKPHMLIFDDNAQVQEGLQWDEGFYGAFYNGMQSTDGSFIAVGYSDSYQKNISGGAFFAKVAGNYSGCNTSQHIPAYSETTIDWSIASGLTNNTISENTSELATLEIEYEWSLACSTVEIEEWASNSIAIYPNPCEDQVYVDMPILACPYSIFDLTGRICQSGMWSSGKPISVSGLYPGMYEIHFETTSKSMGQPLIVR